MEQQASLVERQTAQKRLWDLVPQHEWDLYRRVLEAAEQQDLRFAIGGGLAFSAYARRWRNTKDMDLYVLPEERQAMIDLVRASGFVDYFNRDPYDRNWIFRGYREGVIVDVIWQMANQRAQVAPPWLARSMEITIRGVPVRLLSVEELIWAKLYVLQRERCDWPDLLNVISVQGDQMDWAYLFDQLGDDAPVLGGVMNVLGWMCPDQVQRLPDWIWPRMGLLKPPPGLDCRENRRRVRLLDTRDWFGPKAEEA
jgi:hypothetical protein